MSEKKNYSYIKYYFYTYIRYYLYVYTDVCGGYTARIVVVYYYNLQSI